MFYLQFLLFPSMVANTFCDCELSLDIFTCSHMEVRCSKTHSLLERPWNGDDFSVKGLAGLKKKP